MQLTTVATGDTRLRNIEISQQLEVAEGAIFSLRVPLDKENHYDPQEGFFPELGIKFLADEEAIFSKGYTFEDYLDPAIITPKDATVKVMDLLRPEGYDVTVNPFEVLMVTLLRGAAAEASLEIMLGEGIEFYISIGQYNSRVKVLDAEIYSFIRIKE